MKKNTVYIGAILTQSHESIVNICLFYVIRIMFNKHLTHNF